METIIVYVDDAEYAQLLLQAAVQSPKAHGAHWVLVGCAPRITHRVSRFVSNRSRENWRNKWAERLFQDCTPVLEAQGVRVSTLLARGPLPELLETLRAEHGAGVQLLDMRRPKQLEQATHESQHRTSPLGKLAGTLASMGALWTVLVGEVLAA